MERFMNAIRKAEELEVSTCYFYASEAIKALVLEDTPNGKLRREKELMHLKCAYTVAIMNSRDTRVRMQRDLSKLLDLEIWEPTNFTDELAEIAQDLREAIAYCKEWEARYAQAKAALKEVQA
jgi:hypothetical protein